MSMRTSVAAIAVLALAGPAGAATLDYTADLNTLNDSGVSGSADLTYDSVAQTLNVEIEASGLEAGMPHPQHIHGRLDSGGMPMDSISPNDADDVDGDGFVELAEGLPDYGPILVPLTSPPGGAGEDFPTAPDGTVNFSQSYDVTDSGIFANDFDSSDLAPENLQLREIVLHGMTVGSVGEGTDGEVNGEAGFKAVLPVASGEITAANVPAPIPLPAAGWLMVAGIGGLGAVRARRKAGRA